MCKFSSKSGGVPFQPLGDLTWNDPTVKHYHFTLITLINLFNAMPKQIRDLSCSVSSFKYQLDTGMILSNKEKNGKLCNTKSGHPAHVECAFVGGFGGMLPQENFIFNMVFSTSKHFCCCLRPFLTHQISYLFVHNNT